MKEARVFTKSNTANEFITGLFKLGRNFTVEQIDGWISVVVDDPKADNLRNSDKEAKWKLGWESPCTPYCSECGEEWDYPADRCPHCGAKMIEKEWMVIR